MAVYGHEKAFGCVRVGGGSGGDAYQTPLEAECDLSG